MREVDKRVLRIGVTSLTSTTSPTSSPFATHNLSFYWRIEHPHIRSLVLRSRDHPVEHLSDAPRQRHRRNPLHHRPLHLARRRLALVTVRRNRRQLLIAIWSSLSLHPRRHHPLRHQVRETAGLAQSSARNPASPIRSVQRLRLIALRYTYSPALGPQLNRQRQIRVVNRICHSLSLQMCSAHPNQAPPAASYHAAPLGPQSATTAPVIAPPCEGTTAALCGSVFAIVSFAAIINSSIRSLARL